MKHFPDILGRKFYLHEESITGKINLPQQYIGKYLL